MLHPSFDLRRVPVLRVVSLLVVKVPLPVILLVEVLVSLGNLVQATDPGDVGLVVDLVLDVFLELNRIFVFPEHQRNHAFVAQDTCDVEGARLDLQLGGDLLDLLDDGLINALADLNDDLGNARGHNLDPFSLRHLDFVRYLNVVVISLSLGCWMVFTRCTRSKISLHTELANQGEFVARGASNCAADSVAKLRVEVGVLVS